MRATVSTANAPNHTYRAGPGTTLRNTSTTRLTMNLNAESSVLAYQQNGDDDTVHEDAIDFALQLIGSWTSV